VKNIAVVICEDEFVLNVMLATLHTSRIVTIGYRQEAKVWLTSIDGLSTTWLDFEIKSTTKNENLPSQAFRALPWAVEQAC
jgi:hypothetical protein